MYLEAQKEAQNLDGIKSALSNLIMSADSLKPKKSVAEYLVDLLVEFSTRSYSF